METTWLTPTTLLFHASCLDALPALPPDSVAAIVTDPPYELGFMGKGWDSSGIAFNPVVWAECLRVLKPGGHVLAFGGTRTWHRLAAAIEDAGFEIRDSIAWLYGSGFPKSLDVSKAIDKAAGAEREIIGSKLDRPGYHLSEPGKSNGVLGGGHGLHADADARLRASEVTAPATEEAALWQGWGTALKPAFEPIVVGRKPFRGTVAGNVLRHGTGALNIDGCRVGTDSTRRTRTATDFGMVNDDGWTPTPGVNGSDAGRWPANVVLDDSQAAALDAQSGTLKSGANPTRRGADKSRDAYGEFKGQEDCTPARGVDVGGASRFFYCAKAPTSERPKVDGKAHATVKPLTLMRWLVRLVTPPGGIVLDPFAGSGTTLEAAYLEGFPSIGVELEADHIPLIRQRLERAQNPQP